MEEKVFSVIGTDARQQAAGAYLRRAGFSVAGPTEAARADYLLLPMSGAENQTVQLEALRAARRGTPAFGGRISPAVRQAAQEAGIPLADYYERESLIRLNAVPTAEGCIALLMRHRTRTLWGSPVLVLGFGRVGQAVALRCKALDAHTAVAARSAAARAQARACGLDAFPFEALETRLPGFDTVVNTVPAPVLDARRLACLPGGSLIVDLASSPGGTDLAAAGRLGHTAVPAPGLPGRCAPQTAGELTGAAVLEILRERGEWQ